MDYRDAKETLLLRVPLVYVENAGKAPTPQNLLALGEAVYRVYTVSEPHLVRCAKAGCPNEFVLRSLKSPRRYCCRSCAVTGRRKRRKAEKLYDAALEAFEVSNRGKTDADLFK